MLKFLKLELRDTVRHRNYSIISPLRDYVDILKTYLQLDQKTAETIVNLKGDVLLRSPKNHVIHNSIMCQKCNVHINMSHLNSVRCLTYKPINLHHKISLLQDMGIDKITSTHIVRLSYNMSKSIHRFQKAHDIPATVNTFQNLMKSIEVEWNDVPENLRKVTIDQTSEIQRHCYQKFLEYFIYLRFGHSYEKMLHHLQLYYSFRLLDETTRYLTNEMGFSMDTIKKNPRLLQIRVADARQIISELRHTTINGILFLDFIRKHPIILTSNVVNIKKILEIVEQYGIPQYAVTSCPKIFTKDYCSVAKRIALLNEEHALKIWFQHPRILYMVIYNRKVWKQLAILNSRNASESVYISAYFCPDRMLQRHLDGEMNSTKVLNLKYMLLKHLGIKDRTFILFIMRHPCWRLAELFQMDATLTYLKKQFTVDDIREHIHIILYPVNAVAKMLKSLRQNYTSDAGYEFTPAQYLSLCVYMFEKNRNFNGDSICHIEENEKWVDKSKLEIDDRTVLNDVYHSESNLVYHCKNQ